MSNYKVGDVLKFNGQWRSYQSRVLNNVERYLSDEKIHIVAAPGSGKTTLGIELIKRLDEPTLILAPSITIRDQWKSRIIEGFLIDGINIDDIVSMELEQPKLITVTTYQAVHSAMVGEKKKEVLKNLKVNVICLDECHHLRNEWWKSLEELMGNLKNIRTISLTGTPPFDDTEAMWNRYITMCGEVDEEIVVPELVKEGSLCPHQDYVYFSVPTKEEMCAVTKFAENSRKAMELLSENEKLDEIIKSHKFFYEDSDINQALEETEYLASLLIYLKTRLQPIPEKFSDLVDYENLPLMDEQWLEIMLDELFWKDPDSFGGDENYKKELLTELKSLGLVEKNHVLLSTNDSVEKLLITSKSKVDSIVKIAAQEYKSMGEKLRMLILTDYIRKEAEQIIGLEDSEPDNLGVLPFFEALRRYFVRQVDCPRLGVLCGSMVVIPTSAKAALLAEVGIGKVSFSQIGYLMESDYVKAEANGDEHILTEAMTKLFYAGEIQILVGTAAFLGEGWDSPCINSLILASFVGSYMLSNQMRGRAIRVMKDDPDKCSNIWHLVCLSPKRLDKTADDYIMHGEDINLLRRRMDNFLGLDYSSDVITTGIERLSIIKEPVLYSQVNGINEKMFALAFDRNSLSKRWKNAISVESGPSKMEIVRQNQIRNDYITRTLNMKSLGFFRYIIYSIMGKSHGEASYMLKIMGNGILRALTEAKLLESNDCVVQVETEENYNRVYITGGSTKDKVLFSDCVSQFLAPVDNQRYLLVGGFDNGSTVIYCVPNILAKKKENALIFQRCMKKFLGKFELIYTRNDSGKQKLLEARLRSLNFADDLVNQKEKVINIHI